MTPCIMTRMSGVSKKLPQSTISMYIRGTLDARQEGTSMATVVFVKAVKTTSHLYHWLLQVIILH